MANPKKTQFSEKELARQGFYKGYDVRWLRELGDEHPDGHLVDEFDKKYGKE